LISSSPISDCFIEAFNYAFQLHKDQVRKGSRVPYITHLMAVAALVIENGGDEDEAIAALLHDAVEDQGGLETHNQIRQRFGEVVASIVKECSDTCSTPKPPWRERKEKYLIHLEHASPKSQRVSLADKLHNLRCIYFDYQRDGEGLWERFSGKKEGTLWYYHALSQTFHKITENMMLADFDHTLKQLDQIIETKSRES